MLPEENDFSSLFPLIFPPQDPPTSGVPNKRRARVDYCSVCEKSIVNEGKASQGPRRHILRHHLRRSLYLCPHCTFSHHCTKSSVSRHMKNKHPDLGGDVLVENYEDEEAMWFKRCFESPSGDKKREKPQSAICKVEDAHSEGSTNSDVDPTMSQIASNGDSEANLLKNYPLCIVDPVTPEQQLLLQITMASESLSNTSTTSNSEATMAMDSPTSCVGALLRDKMVDDFTGLVVDSPWTTGTTSERKLSPEEVSKAGIGLTLPPLASDRDSFGADLPIGAMLPIPVCFLTIEQLILLQMMPYYPLFSPKDEV